jgi:hypothetical protein
MDLEIAQPASKGAKRTNGTPNTSANGTKTDGEKPASSSNSRKSQTAVNGFNPASAAKDAIPGTSSFSAKLEEANGSSNSRKRKQPASSTNSTPANGSASKKIFTTAPGVSQGQSDSNSNMVSFENRGAYLEDGKLIADDGTTFSINGQSFSFVSFLFYEKFSTSVLVRLWINLPK